MALVPSSSSTVPTKDPTIPLQEALKQFEASLTIEQQQKYRDAFTTTDPPNVIAFVTQIDANNQSRAGKCVAQRLCTFLDATHQFIDVVDTFVSSNPPIAALIWGSVKFALLTASNVATYFDKVTSMIMAIGKTCPIYKQFGQLYAGSMQLQCALCHYYAITVRLSTKIVEVSMRTSMTQFVRAVWNPFESEFKLLLDELDQATRDVTLRISLASKQANAEAEQLAAQERRANQNHRSLAQAFHSEARQEHKDAQQLRVQRTERQKSRLKSSIRHRLSVVNNLKVWKLIRQSWVPNTAEWLQTDPDFLLWKRAKATATLWCPGTLGVGKTVLMSNVIAHLHATATSTDVVCYHFCRSEDKTSLSAEAILGSLVRQMIDDQIELMDYDRLVDLHALTCDLDTKTIVDLSLPLIQPGTCYYIVLDGLDEIEQDVAQVIAQSIAQLCKESAACLKVILSGRPELEQHLFKIRQFDNRVPVTKARTMEDVSLYSTAALNQCLEDGSLKLDNPKLIIEILNLLQGESEGLFLWTKLFIDEICAQQSDNEIMQALKEPPRKISQLLDLRLARVKKHDAEKYAINILKFCGMVKRPITMDEYRELLSLSPEQRTLDRGNLPNNMGEIITACYGLVFVDEEEGTVHYVHNSVRQHLFMDDHFRPDGAAMSALDIQLGELCLTYLDFDNFKRQLTRQSAVSRAPIQPIQLGVTPVTAPGSSVARMAQKLLRNQRQFKDLSMREVERKTREVLGESNFSQLHMDLQNQQFSFLAYAKTYWIYHLTDLTKERSARSWRLFCTGITDPNFLSDKPWDTASTLDQIPTDTASAADSLMKWSIEHGHYALLLHVALNDKRSLTESMKLKILASDRYIPRERVIHIVVNHTEPRKSTLHKAFHRAVKEGQLDLVDSYLNASIVDPQWLPPNDFLIVSDDRGDIPLIVAARAGSISMAERLLNAGSSVNCANKHKETALTAAVTAGHLDMSMKLLESGALFDTAWVREALTMAAIKGRPDIMRTLLSCGVQINTSGEHAIALLLTAVRAGHLEVVRTLLTAGVKVDIQDWSNSTVKGASRAVLYREALATNRLDIIEQLKLIVVQEGGNKFSQ